MSIKNIDGECALRVRTKSRPDLRNILFLEAHGDLWGAQVVVYDIATRLDPSRFRPFFACLRDGTLVSALRNAGIPTLLVPPHRLRNPFRAAAALLAIRQFALEHKIDIIHANAEFMLLYASLSKAGLSCRSVWHVHDPLPDVRARWHPLRMLMKRMPPDMTIFTTPDVKESIMAAYRLADSQIVFPGVDIPSEMHEALAGSRTGPKTTHPMVLMMARFQRHKGHLDLIAAAQKVVAVSPNVRFLLTGKADPQFDSGYQEEVEAAIRSAGLSEHVSFAGFVSQEQKESLLADATIVVHPARQEPFGLAVAEAMARGKAVVAAAAAGPSLLIEHQESGILVTPGDPSALAEALCRLLGSPAERERLGGAARRRVSDQFSTGKMVEKVEAVYTRLLD